MNQPGVVVEIKEALHKSGLWANLTDEYKEYILTIAVKQEFRKDEEIISEVNRSRDLYLVTDGLISVCLIVPFEERRAEIVDQLRPGFIFGDISFVDAAPRSASVVAVEDSVVYKLPEEALREKMEADHDFGYLLMLNIAGILATKIRQANFVLRDHKL